MSVPPFELKRHHADFFFDLRRFHHRNRIPGTAVQETSIWAFAYAFLAANAENGIHLNAAEWGMVFVRHPEHAGFDGAILHTSGRAGAASATLGDDSQLFGFLLADGVDAFGYGLVFILVGNHAYG